MTKFEETRSCHTCVLNKDLKKVYKNGSIRLKWSDLSILHEKLDPLVA